MASMDVHVGDGGEVKADTLGGEHEFPDTVTLEAIDSSGFRVIVFMSRDQAAKVIQDFHHEKCLPAEYTSYTDELLDLVFNTNQCIANRDEQIVELRAEVERLREAAEAAKAAEAEEDDISGVAEPEQPDIVAVESQPEWSGQPSESCLPPDGHSTLELLDAHHASRIGNRLVALEDRLLALEKSRE